MVGMHVGEEHGLDVGGVDAGGLDVLQHLAGGRQQVVAGARLHQGEPAGRVDQEGVDGVRRAGRKLSARILRASSGVMLRSTSMEPSRKPSLMAVTVMSPTRR